MEVHLFVKIKVNKKTKVPYGKIKEKISEGKVEGKVHREENLISVEVNSKS